jgi:hypothetical protein
VDKLRNVMIATPSYDGRIDALFADSLVNTVKLGISCGINFVPIYMAYDALIQRARNDLAKIAASGDFESVIWVDSDVAWDPEWAIELANREEDIVGGTYRKKTDANELYVVNINSSMNKKDGLIEVNTLGTGFVKVSFKASQDVYNASQPYQNKGGKDAHMVFDIAIVDGELHSEDTSYFFKLKNLGYKIWLDPKMTLAHVGTKVFRGDFQSYFNKFENETQDQQLKYG